MNADKEQIIRNRRQFLMSAGAGLVGMMGVAVENGI